MGSLFLSPADRQVEILITGSRQTGFLSREPDLRSGVLTALVQ